jgi:hypothetical protein
MVLRLADALNVPLRQHNALLLAAGFAPAWPETELGAPELAQISNAIEYMLAQQERFPAVAVDRHWNLLKANNSAVRLVEFLVGPLVAGTSVNLADALVAPNVLRPFLVNWAEVVRYFIRSVEADAAADGSNETNALLHRLLAYKGVRSAVRDALFGQVSGPVLPMHFRKQCQQQQNGWEKTANDLYEPATNKRNPRLDSGTCQYKIVSYLDTRSLKQNGGPSES